MAQKIKIHECSSGAVKSIGILTKFEKNHFDPSCTFAIISIQKCCFLFRSVIFGFSMHFSWLLIEFECVRRKIAHILIYYNVKFGQILKELQHFFDLNAIDHFLAKKLR